MSERRLMGRCFNEAAAFRRGNLALTRDPDKFMRWLQ